ncbi:hypothetical protein KSP39_PZI017595 [Platanthera zijinensis]|uniref:Glucan endo-1,3-beta-D-glucosidase n=1 Tax=Platanthera zijinensis TaxID=2320716 RepID=A0AAP0B5G6_9ASPA
MLQPIIYYLAFNKAPLLVNVYPYYAYAAKPDVVGLDYVLFTTSGVVVEDGNLGYSNMFDAMVDAMRAALEQAGGADVEVVVSETGWPSFGGMTGATIQNAKTYNNNLVKHVKSKIGTPKFPGKEIEVYVYSLFNENLKPEGIKRNYEFSSRPCRELGASVLPYRDPNSSRLLRSRSQTHLPSEITSSSPFRLDSPTPVMGHSTSKPSETAYLADGNPAESLLLVMDYTAINPLAIYSFANDNGFDAT